MADTTSGAGALIERIEDLGEDDAATVTYWLDQDKIAEREERQWIKDARKIVRRYRAETGSTERNRRRGKRLNLFWSNVQTLAPAFYAREPKADVERRFRDDDPASRLSAELLERTIEYYLSSCEFDASMQATVLDRLLQGRGVARVLYIPHFGEKIAKEEGEDDDAEADDAVVDSAGDEGVEAGEEGAGGDNNGAARAEESPAAGATEDREVVFEDIRVKHIGWEDYREGPARAWEEVPWVRYRAYMKRPELVDRFGKEKGEKVTLDVSPKRDDDENAKDVPNIFKTAEVWEIWDKWNKKVTWIAPGTPDLVLDTRDDPLKLPGFYPNPNPLFATMTTDRRVPVPDFIEYEDQLKEIDTLTARIDRLVAACKVAGVYAADEKAAIQQLLDDGTENKLIPVPNWAAFATDKGGLEKLIVWLPIEQVAKVLIQLYDAREKSKQDMYEVTGIADILRGVSDPRETAEAQSTKASFGTMRISRAQKDVQRFARDIIRLIAAIIGEHIDAQTISYITGYPQLDPVPPVPAQPQAPPAPIPPMGGQPGMSGPAGAPAQPPQQQGAPGAPGQPAQPGQQPPAPPSPAQQQYQQQMAQYQQAVQQAQAVQASNAKKTKEFQDAVEQIKRDTMHRFKVDIEADSTIAIDEAQDKADRVEFAQQMVPMIESAAQYAMGNPPLADLMKEITLFTVRGFRVARTLEESIEQAFDNLGQMPPPPQPGQKAPAAGADNPGDLAVRSKEIDSRQSIAQENNQVELLKLASEQKIEQDKMRQTAMFEDAHLQQQERKQEGMERMHNARLTSMASEAAEGLV